MNVVRMFVFGSLLCGLAVSYLYQHSCSNKLTRRIADLDKQRQMLSESLDGVDSDVIELAGFARLESLWVASGRLPAPVDRPGVFEGQVVVATTAKSSDEAAR